MENIEQGIFIRGTLVGVKQDSFVNRATSEVFPFTAIGICTPFVNSFGIETPMTKEIRISKEKLNDAAFMKSLSDNHMALVELEIGVGDFKNLYVGKSAVLNVLKPKQA